MHSNDRQASLWPDFDDTPLVPKRTLREIVQRRGQEHFRDQLLVAYGGRCAVTGCDARAALEAAHIEPYSDVASQDVRNGLLLRADIHTLFDLGLLRIHPESLQVVLQWEISESSYREFAGKRITEPKEPSMRPCREKLALRWERRGGLQLSLWQPRWGDE